MLYHYTSPEVIMRIIREQGICLRFSRYDCLNDTNEGREAVAIQHEVCNQLRDEYADNKIRLELLDSIAALRPDFKSIYVEDGKSEPIRHPSSESDDQSEPIRHPSSESDDQSEPIRHPSSESDDQSDMILPQDIDTHLNIFSHSKPVHQLVKVRTVPAVPYICSFSRERDALNMWNYYTSGTRYEGYNVGINAEGLCLQVYESDIDGNIDRSMPELKCEWWRVIYDKTQQRDKIKDEIERVLKEGKFNREEYIAQLNKWAIRFKNEIFRHEKEERLICYVPEEELENGETLDDYIQFRVVKGCLVPYLDVLVADKSALREITIGPLIEEKLAENTMELFLRLKGYENVEIHTSNAPIRY